MRLLIVAAALIEFVGCSADKELMRTGVTAAESAEIRLAIRKVTKSPVKECFRGSAEPQWECTVVTEDGMAYGATKIHGRWYFRSVVIVADLNGLTGDAATERLLPRQESMIFGHAMLPPSFAYNRIRLSYFV